ncbi:hypothetical protein DFH09DRAFT_1368432 [Mycena vulgaris]|nr:hypothetical protein DFH09DRAFT_1368432 [Mycena vulgaris]
MAQRHHPEVAPPLQDPRHAQTPAQPLPSAPQGQHIPAPAPQSQLQEPHAQHTIPPELIAQLLAQYLAHQLPAPAPRSLLFGAQGVPVRFAAPESEIVAAHVEVPAQGEWWAGVAAAPEEDVEVKVGVGLEPDPEPQPQPEMRVEKAAAAAAVANEEAFRAWQGHAFASVGRAIREQGRAYSRPPLTVHHPLARGVLSLHVQRALPHPQSRITRIPRIPTRTTTPRPTVGTLPLPPVWVTPRLRARARTHGGSGPSTSGSKSDEDTAGALVSWAPRFRGMALRAGIVPS